MLSPLLPFLYTCLLLSFFAPCLLPFFYLSFSSLFFSFLPFFPFPFSCPVLWSLPCPSRFPFHFYCCFRFLYLFLPSLFKQRRKYLCDLARFVNSETVCWDQPRSLTVCWDQPRSLVQSEPCGLVSDKELREYFRRCRSPSPSIYCLNWYWLLLVPTLCLVSVIFNAHAPRGLMYFQPKAYHMVARGVLLVVSVLFSTHCFLRRCSERPVLLSWSLLSALRSFRSMFSGGVCRLSTERSFHPDKNAFSFEKALH